MDHYGPFTLLGRIIYYELESYRNFLRGKLTKAGKVRKDASVNREMSCVRHMFTKGVEWEMMGRSPFGKGKSLQLKENNERCRYPSKSCWARFGHKTQKSRFLMKPASA